MCGIAGYFYKSAGLVDKDIVNAMIQTLVHRGPDDQGIWIDGNIGLAHRRLSIRDLSKSGHQPFMDVDGKVVVSYNGEIYNYQQLRKELESCYGIEFQTCCDTEIIPYGYLVWGETLFDKLEGMFAIALWDRQTNQLILARDGIGIKPLYFYNDANMVIFASEIKALLAHPKMPRNIDSYALHKFFSLGYTGPTDSLLVNCQQVKPGSYMIFNQALKPVVKTYWQPQRDPELFDLNSAVELFLHQWEIVIGDIIQSDVPVSLLQSAGIDSSLIAMQLAKNKSYNVNAFNAKFKLADYDESFEATMVTDSVGMPLHLVDIDILKGAQSVFEAVTYHNDGHLADSSSFAVYLLSQGVRQQASVAISGDGADEFFAGYPTYQASSVARMAKPFIPGFLSKWSADVAWSFLGHSAQRLPVAEVAGRFFDGLATPLEPHAQWRRLIRPQLLRSIYGRELKKYLHDDPCLEYSRSCLHSNRKLIDRCMLADQRFYLPSDMLMKMDRMSMAHGLEVRVPFLDRRIMQLAAKMDHSLMVPWIGKNKKVLRNAYSRLGGLDRVAKRKKTGFNVPVSDLLRGGLASLGDKLLIQEIERIEEFVDPAGIRAMWQSHQRQEANHGYGLWAILTFALWYKKQVKCD